MTCTVTVPPAASSEALVGVSVASHPTPCCRMVKDWPATVTLPVRALPGFGRMVNVAVPFPACEPVELPIQPTLVPAAQLHAGALAVTDIVSVPPPDGTAESDIATLTWQRAASCTTVTSASLMPITAWRGAGSAFGATR